MPRIGRIPRIGVIPPMPHNIPYRVGNFIDPQTHKALCLVSPYFMSAINMDVFRNHPSYLICIEVTHSNVCPGVQDYIKEVFDAP